MFTFFFIKMIQITLNDNSLSYQNIYGNSRMLIKVDIFDIQKERIQIVDK